MKYWQKLILKAFEWNPLSEQPGQMILSAFLETILTEFRARSSLPNSDSEDPVEEKIPNSTWLKIALWYKIFPSLLALVQC